MEKAGGIVGSLGVKFKIILKYTALLKKELHITVTQNKLKSK